MQDVYGVTVTIDNLAGGVIRSTDRQDTVRLGGTATLNNAGTIIATDTGENFGDAVDFQNSSGGIVNNLAGGLIEGSRHGVTGSGKVTVTNAAEGIIIGRNGSAVNIDNGGSEEEKVFITNRGIMEGRSAELDDSDGDAIDTDGLAQILNYGRIAGLGHEGYHSGEPNISEGIAIGGGTIVNSGNAESTATAALSRSTTARWSGLGATTIVNDGLIQGDGHGPEGVDPEDAAQFDLRGNEAINLLGDYEDFVGNNSTGRIIGGVSMGGARDTLNNSGLIRATAARRSTWAPATTR